MKVAVLGYGTVGKGVYEMLKNAVGLEPGPVLVRPGKDDEPFKVTTIEAITGDATVDAVAEVMGGVEPAFTYAAAALRAGKNVVTSNKALVAAKGIELDKLAKENHAAFLFSAACGGGVPILHNLALAAESDEILSVGGILNGTTNFMLDSMQSEGMDYAEALKIAQQLGYAEADPTADVSGMDALRKIMLACAVAYGKLPKEGLLWEGIESITADDVAHFQSLGLTCRLLARGGENPDGSVSAYVEPVLFPANAAECSVLKNFNMAKYEGRYAGRIVMIGQGAGRWPTASAVIRDLSDILHGRMAMMKAGCVEVTADNSAPVEKYYIRTCSCGAEQFEAEAIYKDGDTVIMKTVPMSVKLMHEKAKQIRKDGGKIFFAAVEE